MLPNKYELRFQPHQCRINAEMPPDFSQMPITSAQNYNICFKIQSSDLRISSESVVEPFEPSVATQYYSTNLK